MTYPELHEGVIVQLLRQKLNLSDGLLDEMEEAGDLQETARAILCEIRVREPVCGAGE